MSIRTEFNEQSYEDQQHRQNKSHRQFAKTRLLFLIQASVFDRHSRREFHVANQLILNLANCCSQVTSFKASGYCNHLAQILAFDFCLALVNFDVGNLIESEELSRR